MKVTTVRFGRDLWALLQHEAALAGVSVSQFIREAALTRASAAAGARGDVPFELLARADRDPSAAAQDVERAAALALSIATDRRAEARALRGQSKQAKRMAARAVAEAGAHAPPAPAPKAKR